MRTWVVVLIALGVVGLPLAVMFAIHRPFLGVRHSPDSLARTNVRTLRTAIQQWQAVNHETSCPTRDQLIADGMLGPEQPASDPWSTPYRFRCPEARVFVGSAGPDGRFGTGDDIEFP